MTLHWQLLLYAAVGCLEWFLALRRTLACARGERWLMAFLVLVENLVAFFVLSAFIEKRDWLVVMFYSVGGALGSLLVGVKKKEKSSGDVRD